MTNISERIEANANLTLWCVHVLGPDDVIAAPSHAEAVWAALKANRVAFSRSGMDDIMCFAYAAPWPHSKESHAEDVKNWGKETA